METQAILPQYIRETYNIPLQLLFPPSSNLNPHVSILKFMTNGNPNHFPPLDICFGHILKIFPLFMDYPLCFFPS